jgi:tetratricopeptide (TPR) repeat protein
MDITNSQLLDHACDLREQGKFREAYEEFLRAASNTDNILEKAGILLNAVTNLTQSADFETARNQLDKVRELLSLLNPINLNTFDQDEFLQVTVGIEIERSEILTAEGKLEEAIQQFTKTLEEYEPLLKERRLFDALDDVQKRRAYLWADLGSFEKAKKRLDEMESRQGDNSIFLFYLGHCCVTTKEFRRAQQLLEKAISLGPPPNIAFQAHCSLGMAFYELGEYKNAKLELERGVQTATPRYIKEANIWKWLEYTCVSLGLKADAERYGQLARPA